MATKVVVNGVVVVVGRGAVVVVGAVVVCCKGYIGLYGVCLSIFNRRLRKIS